MPQITFKKDAVMAMLEKAAKAISQKKLAEKMGISNSFLNDVLQGRRNITSKILDHMGMESETIYKLKEGKGPMQWLNTIEPS